MQPDTALAACRLLHDTAAMLLWGTFAYVTVLVPRDLGTAVLGQLDGIRITAVVVAVATTAAALPIEVAAIAEGWADAVDPATARDVLFHTSVGAAWQAQALIALLLAATLGVTARWRMPATAAASGLLLATLALTGHAAMHDGLLGLLHRLNDATHVLAGGAWLGALLPLLCILAVLDDPSRQREATLALRRFSTVGHGAVALVIATGAANTALVLGRWPTAWTSPYQALLATKIAAVLVMTTLAWFNRYVVVPRLAGERAVAVRTLRRATIAEVALGLAALLCVSVFGLLDPS